MNRGGRIVGIAWALGMVACAEGNNPRPPDARVIDAPPGEDGGPGDGGGGDDGGDRPLVTIFQVQDPSRPGHVPAGAIVRIEGAIVAAVDAFEENGVGSGDLGDVWIADPAGGAFSGLHVYEPEAIACSGRSALGLGDVVDVEGTIQEFAVPTDGSGRTVTQLVAARVTCTTAGDGVGPAAEAITVPLSLTTDATAEQWEGVLVELSGVEASGNADTFGTFPLRDGPPVDDDLHRHAGTLRDRFTTLRGVFHYMFGRWALYPRAPGDVVLGAPRVLEDESGAWGCADGADSDGDSAIDCADADCSSSLFCRGATVRVQDVQDPASAMHPAVDADIALVGPLVVTAIDDFPEMAGAGYVGTVVVQDPAALDARRSGIHVFVPDVEGCGGGALALGDRVYVAGRYREYAAAGDTGGTLSEIAMGIVSCRMPGAPLAPAPVAMPSDLATVAGAEPWEGVLVEIASVVVTMPAGTYGRFGVTGGAFVDDDLYRATVVLGDRLTRVAGIVTYQFEPQLEPRAASDVVIAPSERDDATCANGSDDDGDGAIDCSDLDCCPTVPCAGAVSARRLILSEVLYDPPAPGSDTGREWVELRNAGSSAVPLACYVIGNGSIGDYFYSVAQLPAVSVPAGGCVVIGGPDCGAASCTGAIDFEPDILNAPTTGSTGAGVALLYGVAGSLPPSSVPVDAVIYGTGNSGMLLDESGTAPAGADVVDVAAGHSIARSATGGWVDQTTPAPGACTTFTP